MMRVAIIGAGRIGKIRAEVIGSSTSAQVAVVADPVLPAAERLARSVGAQALGGWKQAVTRSDVDIVIVATPTMYHEEIAVAALSAGKHVLCEKPLARSAAEAERILSAARQGKCVLKVGFNYRHMPHVIRAKALIDAGEIGSVYFARCHFGHGGRPGFDREWHTNSDVSGGGVLLEQGIHVLDLFRCLIGEPVRAFGNRPCYFWQLFQIEDNCFCLLETSSGQSGQIHVSWTQWTNTFSLQIYGHDGFLHLSGRDGHYGQPRLVLGRRNADHSRPHEEAFEFEAGTDWRVEWQEFMDAIHQRRPPQGDGTDGLRAQQIVEAVYNSARQGAWVDLPEMTMCTGMNR